ncbi:MAG TPA: class I SAM-dependent methyltransferase [Polyangiaceae bacterium]|nr:class I SAM-dependent methyltransferase [Polyangiaceae bacterium]
MQTDYYATLDAVQERHWWYVARRDILERVLRQVFAEGVPSGTLYDLGCGVGANLPVLEKFGPTRGLDMAEQAVEFCRRRGRHNVEQADLNVLQGIPDASASVVVLADVIEHLDDERLCLEAARRALAPGGALIVTVPAYMFLWSPADDINHHRRRYTAGHLRRVVEPGFEIRHLTYFNTLLFGLVLAGRVGEKLLKRGGDDMAHVPPSPVNQALRTIFAAEANVVPRHRLPFGVSLLCVARKPAERGAA